MSSCSASDPTLAGVVVSTPCVAGEAARQKEERVSVDLDGLVCSALSASHLDLLVLCDNSTLQYILEWLCWTVWNMQLSCGMRKSLETQSESHSVPLVDCKHECRGQPCEHLSESRPGDVILPGDLFRQDLGTLVELCFASRVARP